MAVTVVREEKSTKPVVIQNFVVARPPQRTNFDIADWRNAIMFAELKDFANRVLLYDQYDDALLDPHLKRQWQKRIDNITNTEWCFSFNGKEDEIMKEFIDSPEFEEMLTEIVNAEGWGITLLELGMISKAVFDSIEKRLSVYCVERKHIRPKEGVIVKEQYDSADIKTGSVTTIRYREGRYLDYVAEIGNPKNLGVFLNAVPYVILKKGGVSDWALFVQLFGQPFREYRYNGYDENVRILLEKSAQEMGSAPYIILPDGATLQLHELKNSATGEVHGKLVDYCDKMISILILGQVLTTDNTNVGSNALGNVHAETQYEVFAADKRRVRRILNKVIRPILHNLGLPVKDGLFHPKEEKNLDKVLQRLKIIQMVKSLGEPVDSDTIYNDSDVPKPKDYDKLKADMEAQAQAGGMDDDTDNKPDNKGNKKIKKLTAQDRIIRRLRLALADFFDPAP